MRGTELVVKSRRPYLKVLGWIGPAAVAAIVLTGCADTSTPTDDEVRLGDQVIRLQEKLADRQSSLEDAQSEVEDLEEENEQLQSQLHDAYAPYETAEDDAYLDETEWRQGLVAAQNLLDNERIARGFFDNFVDVLGEQDGVYWSPIEQAQFQARYRDWYRQKYGY